jgi:hypothetical protein
MAILNRLDLYLTKRQYFNVHFLSMCHNDADFVNGDDVWIEHHDYYVSTKRNIFIKLHDIDQYFTLSSRHWVKMIQKDYGLDKTGFIDYKTYCTIMKIYDDTAISKDKFDDSLSCCSKRILRKNMHRWYMKVTLEHKNGIGIFKYHK